MAKKQKRVNAGVGKAAAAARKLVFAKAYITNGCNIKEAAVTAGLSPKTAYSSGQRMLKNVVVQNLIAEATAKAAEQSSLTVERTLKEVARLAYSDPRKLYDQDGNLIPIHLLDDDTAATVASVEVEEIGTGRGEDRTVIGYTKKIKYWDKKGALDMAMKYHGLYEADNKQKPPVLPPVLNIVAVSVRR